MKTFLKIILLSSCAIFILSCASAVTDMASFKSPDYGNKEIRNILICVQLDDLLMRQNAEKEISTAFEDTECKAIPSIQMFSPAKQYSTAEIDELLTTNKIEAVLFVSVRDYDESLAYIPETQYWTFGKKDATVNTTGGYYITKPRVSVKSSLVEVGTRLNIWSCNADVRGNGYAGVTTLADSFGEKLVFELAKIRIIKYPPIK